MGLEGSLSVKLSDMAWLDSIWKVLTGAVAQGDELVPLDRVTPLARQALALARLESERLGHDFIGTEHVLLGLIGLGKGVAFNVLTKLGVDLKNLRTEVEKQVASGGDRVMDAHIPYTPRVKRALELADKERRAINHTYVGTEHILLGLIREGDGLAGRILKGLGLNSENVRQEVLIQLDPNFAPPPEKMPTHRIPFQKANWTPRALEVFATATALAAPAPVEARHLLLALQAGETVASKTLRRLGINPSAVLDSAPTTTLLPDGELYLEDFSVDLRRDFPDLAIAEARRMGWSYLGTDCLLLFVSRVQVPGVELSYDAVRQAIIEINGPS